MESLIDLLEASTSQYCTQPALAICRGLGTEVWSYERLWHAAEAAAADLREQYGLHVGDRVLVSAPNSPELVAVHFGCLRAGAILVPLDDGSTAAFVDQVATATEASLVISGAGRDLSNCGLPVIFTFRISLRLRSISCSRTSACG